MQISRSWLYLQLNEGEAVVAEVKYAVSLHIDGRVFCNEQPMNSVYQ